MTPHIPKELCTRIDWSPFAIMGHTMPPETLMKRTRTKRTTTKKTTAPTNRQSCASRTKSKQDAFSPFTRSGSRDDERDRGHGGQWPKSLASQYLMGWSPVLTE
jgi:hypothetical protein